MRKAKRKLSSKSESESFFSPLLGFWFNFFCDMGLFAEKITLLPKILWDKIRNKATKIGVENRAQHASQGHLSALKTDCNSASMPRREYQSSCVCVPPGGGSTLD